MWFEEVVECVPLEGADERTLSAVDLVVVGGDSEGATLRDWITWPARQPCIVIEPGPQLEHLLSGQAASGTPRRRRAARCQVVHGFRTPTFDNDSGATSRWRPRSRTRRRPRAKSLWLPVRVESSSIRTGSRWLKGGRPVRSRFRKDSLTRGGVANRIRAWDEYGVRQVGTRILEAAGFDLWDRQPAVTAIAVTKRPEQVPQLVGQLAHMRYPRTTVRLGTHGFDLDAATIDYARTSLGESLEVSSLPGDWTLGRCLNEMIDASPTEYWAKIDDDDFYGPPI